MTIGENIKRLRSAKGMTQKELADKLFITPQALSRWENGTAEPGAASLKQLASIFGVTVDTLISGEEGEKAGKPLATCEKCGKPLYEENEIRRRVQKVRKRRGPHHYIAEETHVLCASCADGADGKTDSGASASDSVNESAAPEVKVIVPRATCEKCGRLLYEEDEICRYVQRVKTGRHHSEEKTHVLCSSCNEKRKEEIKKRQMADLRRRKERGVKFRIGSYFGGVAFGALAGLILGYCLSLSCDIGVAVGCGIGFGVLGYLTMASFILGNNLVPELAMDIVKFGFKLPFGIIVGDLVDLIVLKLFLALLSLAVTIASIALAVMICGFLGIFAYPLAIAKAYKNPELCWD